MNNNKESNFILFKGLTQKETETRKQKIAQMPLVNIELNNKYRRTESLRILYDLFSESPIRRSDIPKKSKIDIHIDNNYDSNNNIQAEEGNNIKEMAFCLSNRTKEEEESSITKNNNSPLELSAYLKQKYLYYFNQVVLIQSYWRGYKSRNLLSEIQLKVFIIQRAYRKHLHIKYGLPLNYYQIDQFLFKENESLISNYQINLSHLFPALFIEDISTSNMFDYSKAAERDKIHFFCKILDFDLMISSEESYDTAWGSLFDSIYVHCCKINTPIQIIELGSQHTLCLDSKGILYSFGWNNYGQCGEEVDSSLISHNDYCKLKKEMFSIKNSKSKINISPINCIAYVNSLETETMTPIKNISCGEDHSLVLDSNGTVWGFGLNLSGQLGEDNKRKIVQVPTIIKELNQEAIKQVKCDGNISYVLNERGDAFMWPWSNKSSGLNYTPIKLQLKDSSEKIKMIACGNNFVLLLSGAGKVHSMGKDNKYGQLGHGDSKSRYHPCLISHFEKTNDAICQISCGFKHCVAKSVNGRAFTWGLGTKGQLGIGSFENKLLPHLIKFHNNNQHKVYQVTAGFRSTYILTNSLKIYICGCNGTSPANPSFVHFDPGEKIPEMKIRSKYSIVRIMTTWNKSFSIFYATIADRSKINESQDKIDSVLNKLASCWNDDNVNSPFIQDISDYFGKNAMISNKKAKSNTKYY